MNKILVGAASILASATMLATPVSATGLTSRSAVLDAQLSQLDRRIDSAEQRDLITGREASQLERQVDLIADLHNRYERGGLTRPELRLLNQRVEKVGQELASVNAA